jgi:hypothetical protein
MELPKDHRCQSCLDDPRLEDLARYWLELTSYDLGKWLAHKRHVPVKNAFERSAKEQETKSGTQNYKPETKFEGKR